MDRIDALIDLYETQGVAQYGREAASQAGHALQCAALAEAEGAAPLLVVAALLHDVGHLLAKVKDDEHDDRHEHIGWGFLKAEFGAAVSEPVRLHVDAKRCPCAVEPAYVDILSPAFGRSVEMQGGKLAGADVEAFRSLRHAEDATRLRRWDDQAKVPGAATRSFRDYTAVLRALRR